MNATEAYQRTFAAHLRNPEQATAPHAVNPERMQVYVDLLFNNLQDFLSTAFPVTHSILMQQEWLDLVRAFYANHACQSPYFRDISGEWVAWLSQAFATLPVAKSYPFLLELMHYEWLEIALLMQPDPAEPCVGNPDGDLLHEPLVFNPHMVMQSYQYAVQQISATALPTQTQLTHLLLVRNYHTHQVDFIELNAVTAQLLVLLQSGMCADSALMQLADTLRHPEPSQLVTYGLDLLVGFKGQSILLGTRVGSS